MLFGVQDVVWDAQMVGIRTFRRMDITMNVAIRECARYPKDRKKD